MAKEQDLIEAVVEKAKELDGRRQLTCKEAFGLAEEFGAEARESAPAARESLAGEDAGIVASSTSGAEKTDQNEESDDKALLIAKAVKAIGESREDIEAWCRSLHGNHTHSCNSLDELDQTALGILISGASEFKRRVFAHKQKSAKDTE